MDKPTGGKRLAPDSGRGKWVVISLLIVVLLLAALYLGLCVYTDRSGAIFPNVTAAGMDVSGLTRGEAEQRLAAATDRLNESLSIHLSCGPWSGELFPDGVRPDPADTAQRAWQAGREHFLTQGFQLIRHLLGAGSRLPLNAVLTEEGSAELNRLLDEADSTLPDQVVQPGWQLEGTDLVLTAGIPGRVLDRDATRTQLLQLISGAMDALVVGTGDGTVSLELQAAETLPEPLDLQSVYREVHVLPQSAAFDPATRQIVPHVVGLSFDVPAAAARLDAAGEGQRLVLPLTQTRPELTAEELEAHLFSDLLGECSTVVTGTKARISNVALAASKCHDLILMPGEVFSYNGTVGPRTVEAGFLPAPAYLKGETIDEVGGGICQVSSTLYLAAMRANLEIVERRPHSFISSYITAGMDATVSYGSIDFRLKNNTAYPIRIEAVMEGNRLYVRFWGDKADDTTVKMTYSILETTPHGVVYQPDETIPQGTTKVSVTPYNGYKVVVYRNLYDGEGNLISTTEESRNKYNRRDEVILFNPADAASLGLTPDGQVIPAGPAPTPEPEPSPEPAPSPEPTPTPTPEPAPTPEPTPAPEPDPIEGE